MSTKAKIIDALLCCWIIAAQIWYYSQFKELFLSMATPLLRRLWH
jgi:hypothetical protein